MQVEFRFGLCTILIPILFNLQPKICQNPKVGMWCSVHWVLTKNKAWTKLNEEESLDLDYATSLCLDST
jgi:hypothetical protein